MAYFNLPAAHLADSWRVNQQEAECIMKTFMIEMWSVLSVLAPLLGMTVASQAVEPPAPPVSGPFELPSLPYGENALEPYVSAKTINFHYGKHHRAYVDNLNKLIAGTPWAGQPLEKVIQGTAGVPDKTAVFNNAAQDWNHTFFWHCMAPGGGGQPNKPLLERIKKSFGSFEKFKDAFVAEGVAQFGSGWVWLVQDGDSLKVVKTSNADTPIAHGQTPLLTCDVWEHAYYLDYQNRRKDFAQTFLDHLANWDFAASQLK
jgi:Fe-Mn family superoxide dismutase